jgi:hypothetical protein
MCELSSGERQTADRKNYEPRAIEDTLQLIGEMGSNYWTEMMRRRIQQMSREVENFEIGTEQRKESEKELGFVILLRSK